MPDAKYKVKVGGAEYLVSAPDANTAWQWANMTHAQGAAPAAPAPVAAPITAPTAAPVAPQEEDKGFFPVEAAKGLIRGIGSTISGVGGKFIEELPQIAAEAYSLTTPEGMGNLSTDTANWLMGKALGKEVKPLTRTALSPADVIMRKVTTELAPEYKEAVAPAARTLRGIGEGITEALPRKYSTFQEAEGFWESTGALGVTLAEGAFPTLAGATVGYITKNPSLASGIIGAATFPQTYSGVRDTQAETGTDDMRRALVSSSLSSALDMLLGTGGKVRDVATVQALQEFLEGGLRNAAKEVAKTSFAEGGTEAVQNIIEQVGGGLDPTTKESLQQTLEAGLVGMLGGATFTGAVEGVQALARRKIRKTLEETDTANDFAQLPGVEDEYVRLLEGEVTAAMEANPDLTQRQAFDQAKKNAEPLYRTAIENVIMATGGADESAGVGAGLDVGGGLEPSIPDVGELGRPTRDTGAVGEAVTGPVGGPDLGVPVPDVGQAEQPGALAPAEAAPKPAFDTTPIFEASTLKDRKSAAMQVTSDIVQEVPELQGLSKNKYNQAATQMANAAAKGTQFDPLDVLYKVAGIEPAATAPEVAAPEVAAPAPIAEPTLAERPAEPGTDFYSSIDYFPNGLKQIDLGQTPDWAPKDDNLKFVAGADFTKGAPNQVVETRRFKSGDADVTRVTVHRQSTDASTGFRGQHFGVSANIRNAVVTDAEGLVSMLNSVAEQLAPNPEVVNDPAVRAQTQAFIDAQLPKYTAPVEGGLRPATDEYAYLPDNNFIAPNDVTGRKKMAAAVEAVSRGEGPKWALIDLHEGKPVVREGVELPDAFEVAPEAPTAPTAPPVAPAAPTTTPTQMRTVININGEETVIENAPSTGKKPKVVSKGKEVKLTEAQRREAVNKAEAKVRKLNRIQKRIAATNKTDEVLSGQLSLAKLVRGDKENIALLKGALDTFNAVKWRTILPTLSTEDIFRIIKDRIPSLNEADRIIRQDITRFETKEYLKLAAELEEIAEFLKKFPKAAQALSDLQFASVAYQVDPSKAANATEYADKFDKKTKDLKEKLAKTLAGDTKTQKSLQTKIENRFKDIESVYEGAMTKDGPVVGWNDLGRPGYGANRGKHIFKLIRDAHRRDLEASYNALRSRLMETKEGEALDEALEKLEKQFKPAMDQTIYFPAMRFGSYYARVGTGENSIFKMFETENKRNQFVRLMEARGEEVSETGNVEDLRNNFQKTAGGPLKGVLDLFEDNPKDMGALKNQVFDLWLQTMSAGDMRKHMAPRKMRAGYSTDILKNYANFRRSSINGAKRAQFGYKLENAIGSAKASVEQQPDEPKLQAFIEEIRLRALNDLTPPSRDDTFFKKAIALGNKAAFYQYLANPKTALIQLTQLHIVALPMLSQKFGTVEATMALSKYGFSSLGGMAVSPLKAIKRGEEGGGFMGFTFNWEQPNLLDNPISTLKQESDPELYEVLSEGWQEGRDLNLYMDTFANDIGGYGMLDPQQRSALQELMRGRVDTAALRGATFTFEAMGALMHQMERTNREATYMAALELAYRQERKAGKSHDVAKQIAIESATETTMAATFNFSAYNKPRILTSDVGRLAGQFMTYPYMMSSLLVRNLYTAIKFGPLEPGERLAAAQTAAGALINIGLYAGLTGLPLYGLAKVIGSMLAWAFDDDDEEGGLSYIDEDGNVKATYDIDWWFRNVFIPRHFGADGTVANLFDLEDATAEMLARAVEKGPISAITDIDLANSVALDFMFFLPEAPRAEKPEQQVIETVFNTVTGAAGGVAMDYIKAGTDAMNGYTLRAMEKLPKLYGNAAKAMRFSEEGQRTYQGELLGMDKDFWTSDKAILLSLGFNSTEAGQRQKQFYDAKKIDKAITAERNKVLSQWRKFVVDVELKGYTPELEAERDRVLDARDEYNSKFPTDPIGTDTLFETQTNALEKMRKSDVTRGVPIDEKSPYLQDILVRRLNAEEAKAAKEQ